MYLKRSDFPSAHSFCVQARLALTRYFRAAFTLSCSIQARSNSNATLARNRYYRAAITNDAYAHSRSIRTRSNSNASLAPLITWLARVKYVTVLQPAIEIIIKTVR